MDYNTFLGFLENFKKLNSFNKRIKYTNENLNRIGSGTGRIVYDIDDKLAFKIAKNNKGIAQNEVEIDLGTDQYFDDVLAQVKEYDENGQWIVVEKGKKVTPKRIEQVTGIPNFNQFYEYIRSTFSDYKFNPDNIDDWYENEWANDIIRFIADSGQDRTYLDYGRQSTYGEVNRNGSPEIIIVDYGLNDKIAKQHYTESKIYELHDINKGGMYDEFSDGQDAAKSFWAYQPFNPDDGLSFVNEKFVKFVENKDEYLIRRPIFNIATLTEEFHDAMNNFQGYLSKSNDKKRYIRNLIKLQEYLVECGRYNHEKMFIGEYNSDKYSKILKHKGRYFVKLNENSIIGKELEGKLFKKLNIDNPRYLSNGVHGTAYDIGNNKVLKITTDVSEAVESVELLGKNNKYLADIYKVFRLSSENLKNNNIFVLIIEKLEVNPTQTKEFEEKISGIEKLIDENLNLNIGDVFDFYGEDRYEYHKNDIDKLLSNHPQLKNFFQDLLNIREELDDNDIISIDFLNPRNLGITNNGNVGFFDIGFGNTEFNNEHETLKVNEYGGNKFSTPNNVGGDLGPVYNNKPLSPSISNNLDANRHLYTERVTKYMPQSKNVKIKDKCKLGGGSICNQGDINNIELYEDIDPKQAYTEEGSINTVIDKQRDVGFTSLIDYDKDALKSSGVGLIGPIKQDKMGYANDMYIIYNDENKAKELQDILTKNGGYLPPSSTPEEVRKIGELLGYNKESIDSFINKKISDGKFEIKGVN